MDTLRLRATSTSVKREKRKMVRRSATMTSLRLRRSSISLARNIGSGLHSLKETLTGSMQDISEGSKFYLTDNEEVDEDENEELVKSSSSLLSNVVAVESSTGVESADILALFNNERYNVLTR